MSGTAGELTVRIPEGMVFPVSPNGPVRVRVRTKDGDNYVMLIGGVGPQDGDSNEGAQVVTFRHQRLIMRLLFGRRFDAPEVPISYMELMRGSNVGGNKYKRVQRLINELSNCYVKIIRANGTQEVTRLVTFRVRVYPHPGVEQESDLELLREDQIEGRSLKSAVFAPEFWRACLNWEECWPVRADMLDCMSSDVAATLYMSLAPNTHNPGTPPGHRFLKNARRALMEIGAKGAERMPTSELIRTFERKRSESTESVLAQMDGKAMLKDVFRVAQKLEPNESGTDYNIVYWREAEPNQKQSEFDLKEGGVLFDLWVKQGLPPQQFIDAARPEWKGIEKHEIDTLLELGYELGAHRRYLEKVRSYIGPQRFQSVLGSIKLARVDGTIDHIGKYVGGALRDAFSEWLGAFKKSGARLGE